MIDDNDVEKGGESFCDDDQSTISTSSNGSAKPLIVGKIDKDIRDESGIKLHIPGKVKSYIPNLENVTPSFKGSSLAGNNSNSEGFNERSDERASIFIRLLGEIPRKFSICVDSGNRFNPQLTALLACILCFLVLCLFIVKIDGHGLSLSPEDEIAPKLEYEQNNQFKPVDREVPTPFARLQHERNALWTYLPTLVSSKPKLNFFVGRNSQILNNGNPTIISVNEQTYQISGRPKFCTDNIDVDGIHETVFLEATHVHLSDMNNCFNYVHIILNSWSFPKIRHIKLHRMVIRKQEFLGLTRFIDRHNDTITRVEIDESFLCPSPDCDAGMINFPDHDFQLIVTRRRESPEWI